MKLLAALLMLVVMGIGCKGEVPGGSAGTGPVIFGITPQVLTAGSPATSIICDGAGFLPSSKAKWDGSPRPTNFVSGSRLSVEILPADLALPKTVAVTVSNPDGSTSEPVNFVIAQASVPTVTKLTPASAVAGDPSFTLLVDGSGFDPATTVLWNGSARATRFVSSQEVSATILANDIRIAGTAQVSVSSAANALPFRITSSTPAPLAVSLQSFQFTPNDIAAVPGQSVVFTNNDGSTQHTVSRDIGSAPGPDAPILNPGQTYTFRVPPRTVQGTNIFYHCNFHGAPGDGTSLGAGMTGVIRVR